MKDRMKNKYGLDVIIKHKGVPEPSRIFCDEIRYMHIKGSWEYSKNNYMPVFDHHLMFYDNKNLVFKVWLPNRLKDKKFKDIHEALESVGIKVIKSLDDCMRKLTRKELKEIEREEKDEKYCEEVLGKTKPIKDRLNSARELFKKKKVRK